MRDNSPTATQAAVLGASDIGSSAGADVPAGASDGDASAGDESRSGQSEAPATTTGWGRLTAWLTGQVDRLDAAQQRHRVTAVPVAVAVKYADDSGSRLTGLIAHTAFLAVFPMLLMLLTGLELFLSGEVGLQHDITAAVLRQFPVLGTDLQKNIKGLSGGNVAALAFLLLWLLYGATRLSRNAQIMMATVWDVPRSALPNFFRWLPRAIGFLVIIGLGFIAGGTVAGIGAFGGMGPASAWVGIGATFVVNAAMFWSAFVVIVAIPDSDRSYWRGAVVAAAGWTLLQVGGAQLVSHELRHFTTLYGAFAIIIVLIWWLTIGAAITVWSAELDIVLVRHQWPRSFRRVVDDERDASVVPSSSSA